MAKGSSNHRPGDGSTGPTTPAGKERCSRNALSHGARSENHVILPTESAAEYAQLRRHWYDEFPPVTEHEKSFLERLAQREWHLRRCERLHDDAHLRALLNNPDPMCWSEAETKHIDLMTRYRNAADRAWRTALKDVKDLRKYRLDMILLAEKTKRLYFQNLRDGATTAPPDPDPTDETEDSPNVEKETPSDDRQNDPLDRPERPPQQF